MRILHTMLRVIDLNRSINFYTQLLGMRLLKMRDNPQYRYTLAFVGYGEEESDAAIELTYNYDIHQYEKGNGYGHIAVGVADVAACCTRICQAGGKVTREAGPVKGGSTIIAFIEDPDGYQIELIEKKWAE